MKSKGADISGENSNESLAKDVQQIIDASDVLWKDGVGEAGSFVANLL